MTTERPRLLIIVTVPMSFMLGRGQARLMSTAGFEVHAVSSPGEKADRYSQDEHVPVHPVPMARRMAPWADLVSLGRLLLTINRVNPSVVQAGTPKAGLLGTIAAWMLRVPVRIYYIHGLPLLTARGLRRLILTVTERLACAAATHVICVGPSIRDEVAANRLCARRKLIVVGYGSSNGVDTRAFDRTRLPPATRESVRGWLGIPADAPVVGFIGRVGREKGIEQLSHAWRTVRDRCPSAHLVIIGPDEPNDPVPLHVLQELAQDCRVHLIGADWDVIPWYAAMDLFCLPSHREGCPNVALEAAAMELPVVAFGVPGVIDAVESGVTGCLVAPLSVEALAEALERYLTDPGLRRRHGRNGRERVRDRFEREKVWLELTKFYSSVNYFNGDRTHAIAETAPDPART